MTAETNDGFRRRLRVAGRTAGSLLLGSVAILGSAFLFRQGLLPVIDATFRPGPEWLSVLRRAGIFTSALAGYWAYLRWHERRAATELHVHPARVLLGGAIGAALVGLPIGVLFALGAYELVLVRAPSPPLLGVAVLIGIAATLEELMYRALLLQVLERASGTWVALVVQAVVFALAHLENLGSEKGGEVRMLVAVSLLGLLWGAVFVLTRNLWVAAANHAAWNFTILLSGVPLSGIEDWRAVAPLASRYAGADWLTGGTFGPESSVLVMAATTAAVVLVLRVGRRKGAFVPSTPGVPMAAAHAAG